MVTVGDMSSSFVTRGLVLLLGTGALLGCHAGSTQPLFTPEDVVTPLPAVQGTFQQEGEKGSRLTIEPHSATSYKVVFTTDDGTAPLVVVPFTLKGVTGKTFVDAQLMEDASTKGVLPYVVRPHFLLAAEIKDDALTLWPVDSDFIKGHRGSRGFPSSTAIGNGESTFVLFTDETKALRNAIKKYAGQPKTWAKPVVFRRVKS
ncbi:MAG: hypothetical protein AB2A00_28640 [Myxococcota bacterium]